MNPSICFASLLEASPSISPIETGGSGSAPARSLLRIDQSVPALAKPSSLD